MDNYISFIICFLFVFLIAAGILFQKGKKSKIEKSFLSLLLTIEAYIFVGFFSELIEFSTNFEPSTFILYFVNAISYFLADAIILSFCNYLYLFLKDKTNRNPKELGIIYITTAIRIVTLIVLLATNNLFVIENGTYYEKSLSFIPYIISSIIMIEFVVIVLIHNKEFSKRQLFAILSYQLIPVIPIIIEMFSEIYVLSSVGLTLSVLCIYVFMQASTIESSRLRESVLEELSSKDLLTGLNNRRQYYNRINEYRDVLNLGVMFLDINGLKYTNDHFGHAKGDELIKKFSRILCSTLNIENIYRISGDEFVVIIPGIKQEEFEKITKELHHNIINNNDIAAMGYSFGGGECIERLVSEAEEKMYVDKNNNGYSRTSNIHNKNK